jgi:Na+-transporting methylmalonyl-CoA/oxaloacetate decarboxylase gamma subunit
MDDLGFGLQVTIIGMSLVFGLLALLWGALELVAVIDRRQAESPSEPVGVPPATKPIGPEDADLSPEARAALAVALHLHINRRRVVVPPQTHAPGSRLFASRWVASGRARQTQPWRRR